MVECEFQKSLDNNTAVMVLIDTWWNVNLKILRVALSLIGFNRYMVECE